MGPSDPFNISVLHYWSQGIKNHSRLCLWVHWTHKKKHTLVCVYGSIGPIKFGGNMTLMISVYKGHIPMLGSNRPHYTNNDYFSFFLSLICVSGCRGPKFKFTAKNIASGFFSDLLSET